MNVATATGRCAGRVLAGALLALALAPPVYAQDIPTGERVVGTGQIHEKKPPAFGTGVYGNLAVPPGSPRPDMWFATGSLNPNKTLVVGLSSLMLAERQGSDRAITSAVNLSLGTGTDMFGVGGAPVPPVAERVAPGGIGPFCFDNHTPLRLQKGGTFWTAQARSVVPTQFPRGVITGTAWGTSDPLALGPTGHPVNVPPTGPAGAWCRPPPLPMWQSSPMETYGFWIALCFPLMVIVVFWLTRGFRIRGIPEAQ